MKLLSDLFYDPSVGYTWVQGLFKAAKKKKKSIKLDDVRKWLRKQNTYTLHKPIRRKFRRRQTVVGGIDYQWQGDLADVSSMSKYNDGYRYLFCLIDVFSDCMGCSYHRQVGQNFSESHERGSERPFPEILTD